MTGPMEQRMGGVIMALDEFKTQTAQMEQCVATAAQAITNAMNTLMSGVGLDAFQGTAATTAANTVASLEQQMQRYADSTGTASKASGACHDRIRAAAVQVDQQGWGVEAFVWVVNEIDAADAMMHGATPGLFARLLTNPLDAVKEAADRLLTRELPQWAEETQAATSACVGALTSIEADLVAVAHLAPIDTGVAGALSGVAKTIGRESAAQHRADVATALAGCLKLGVNPYSHEYTYDVTDPVKLAQLEAEYPDAKAIINQTLEQHWNDSDVECVAFVYMVMGIADNNSTTVSKTGRYAVDFWTQAAEFNLAPWQKIPNGSGMPQPGDIIVLSGGDAGHVAIVTGVGYHPPSVTIAQANTPKSVGTIETLAVKNGMVQAPWKGYDVLGFIRQFN